MQPAFASAAARFSNGWGNFATNKPGFARSKHLRGG